MRILLLFLLSILSGVIILIVYHYNKENPILEYSVNRNIQSYSLDNTDTYELNNDFSLMKYYKNKVYFVNWTKSNYNKIYFSDIDKISNVSYLELNIKSDNVIIGEYFIQDTIIEIFNKFDNSLIKFNKNGEKISSFKFPFFVSRISKLNTNNYIISGWDQNDDTYSIYYKKYNSKENTIEEISFSDELLQYYSNMNGIILDGMYFNNNNYSVNLPYAINKAFIFNTDFIQQKSLNLIYKKVDFKFRTMNNGEVYSSPNNIYPNISGYLTSSNIFYLLTQDEDRNYFIDLYNIEKNKYIESFSLKERTEPRELFYLNGYLYILFKTEVKVYNINQHEYKNYT